MSKRAVARVVPGFNITYFKTETSTASNQNLISSIDLTSQFSFLHAGASIKFILNPGNNLKVYLKGVGNMAFVIDSRTEYISTNIYTHAVSSPAAFAIPKKMGFSVAGGAGVSFGRLDGEINYMSNLVSTEKSPEGKLGTIYLAVGFRFIN